MRNSLHGRRLRTRRRRRPIQSHSRSSIASRGRESVFRKRLVKVLTEEMRVDDALEVGNGRDLPDDGRGCRGGRGRKSMDRRGRRGHKEREDSNDSKLEHVVGALEESGVELKKAK